MYVSLLLLKIISFSILLYNNFMISVHLKGKCNYLQVKRALSLFNVQDFSICIYMYINPPKTILKNEMQCRLDD